eukprot:scaffold139969_cov93-Phaeocystis_antarctica.AAC.1
MTSAASVFPARQNAPPARATARRPFPSRSARLASPARRQMAPARYPAPSACATARRTLPSRSARLVPPAR